MIKKIDDIRNEVRFECQKCGKCCSSEIILSYPDIRKLVKNKNATCFTNLKFNHRLIKNNIVYTTNSLVGTDKNNPCVFLENNKCTVHSFKPKICETYPFSIILANKDTTTHIRIIGKPKKRGSQKFNIVLIDLECPGFGRGEKINLNIIFEKCYKEYLDHQKSYSY